MGEANNEKLLMECQRIETDSEYNAETHHNIAVGNERFDGALKYISATLAAASGAAVLLGVPTWVAWFSIISGALFGLTTAFGPGRCATEHTKAAKEFTVLKHDARSLRESFYREMSHSEFYIAVRIVRERYNSLVTHTPKTTDKDFEKARAKIQSGRHSPDTLRPPLK